MGQFNFNVTLSQAGSLTTFVVSLFIVLNRFLKKRLRFVFLGPTVSSKASLGPPCFFSLEMG